MREGVRDPLTEGEAAVQLALVVETLGQIGEATDLLLRAMKCFQSAGSIEGLAEATGYLGFMRQSAGEAGEAEPLYREARRLEQQLGRSAKEAECLANLANIRLGCGRVRNSEQLLEQALCLCETAGDPRGATGALVVLGHVRLAQDREHEAEGLFRQALEQHEQDRNWTGEAVAWMGLAEVHGRRGDDGRQTAALECVATLYHRAGHVRNAWSAYEHLASRAAEAGDALAARGWHLRSAQVAEEVGLPELAARAWIGWGWMALSSRSSEEASEAFERALAVSSDQHVAAAAHRGIGACGMADGREPEGVAELVTSARLFDEAGDAEQAAEARRAILPPRRPRR